MQRAADLHLGAGDGLAFGIRDAAEISVGRLARHDDPHVDGFLVVFRFPLVLTRGDLVLHSIHPAITDAGFDPIRRPLAAVQKLHVENIWIDVVKMKAPGSVRVRLLLENLAAAPRVAVGVEIVENIHLLAAHRPARGVHHLPCELEPALEQNFHRLGRFLIGQDEFVFPFFSFTGRAHRIILVLFALGHLLFVEV